MKKTIDYIFIVLAIVLTIAAIGQLSDIISTFINLSNIFSSSLDSYEKGKITGKAIYWIIHLGLIVLFFSSGNKRPRASKNS